jgi:hypothetical protein
MATGAFDSKRAQFLALAGTAFERMFGGDGQNGLVTFAEREERACEVSDELARWLMAEHVAQDRAGRRDQEVEQRKTGELQAVYSQPAKVVAAHVDAGKTRLRAEDGRGVAFYAHRPRGPAVGRNRVRLIA